MGVWNSPIQILPIKVGQNCNLDRYDKDHLDFGDWIKSSLHSKKSKMFSYLPMKLKSSFYAMAPKMKEKVLFTLWLQKWRKKFFLRYDSKALNEHEKVGILWSWNCNQSRHRSHRPANSREHVLDDAHASIAATRFNYGMIAAAFDLIA